MCICMSIFCCNNCNYYCKNYNYNKNSNEMRTNSNRQKKTLIKLLSAEGTQRLF